MNRTLVFSVLLIATFSPACNQGNPNNKTGGHPVVTDTTREPLKPNQDSLQTDTASYNKKVLSLLHNKTSSRWPPRTPYPLPGALLPFNRVVAYYGNLYSAGMGILGELAPSKMLKKLKEEAAKWQAADSTTPVIPALHYIAVTAQGSKGASSKYRLRMPFTEIDKVLKLADSIDGIVFLDIQVGHSSLQEEIPLLEKYLSMPGVHLGIDAEYSMKNGKVPSTSIGTFDAADVNYASEYLSGLVKKYHLPPKILVVHRFTDGMITNYKKIITRPEVQIVINMDGFGPPAKKINSYQRWVADQPVQFTGFKLFYKQDANMMQPEAVLKLTPVPVYIQYQ